MDQYDYFTREQMLSMLRALGEDRAAGRGAACAGIEGFPEFGEHAMREFERCPSPMRIFDPETRKYLAVNQAAVEFYGYTRDEFLKLTVMDTRHPEEHRHMLGTFDEQRGYLRHGPPRRQIKKNGDVAVTEAVTQDVLFKGRRARVSLTIDITGRLRMQELLWRRQQEFESLAENLPDLVARFDRDHRFVYVNAAVEKLTGRNRSEFIGMTQRELGMPTDIVEAFQHSLGEAIRTGQARLLEFRFPAADGERLFEAHHAPELDVTGVTATVLCIARDITERKRATEELDRQRQLLDAVVENLPVGVFIRDAKGRYVRRNRVAQRRFGDAGKPIEETTVHDLFPRERADRFLESDLRLFQSGEMEEIRDRVTTHPETGQTWLEDIRKVPLYDERKEPWLIVGVVDDITERKQAQDMQSRLAAIVNNSSDAIISKDLDGVIRTWNPGAERLFGYSADEVIGRSIKLLIPSDRQDEETLILARIQGGEQVDEFESVRCRKNGTRVHVALTISPIRDPDGRVIGASQIARDITERKQSELAVLRSAALARLLESLARAANEAGTPEEAMAACLERICRHGNWTIGRVALFEEGDPKGVPTHSIWRVSDRERFGSLIQYSNQRAPNPRGRFMGRVVGERVPVWIEDFEREVGFKRRELVMASGLRSAFAFPIIARGAVVALMEVFSEQRRPPDAFLMGAVPSIASQLARIVEREQAHRANARMAAIVEASQDAILSRALDGRVLTWNAGAERLFGYAAAEIIGQKIDVLYPPELVAEMRHRQTLLEADYPVAPYETVRVAKDGRRIHVSTSPAPIRDPSGRVCGVSTIIHDISARRAAEQALREGEERFRQLAENIQQVFWIAPLDGSHVIYVSPAYEQIWGKKCEALYRNATDWMESIHPEDQSRVIAGMNDMARGRPLDVEYRVVRPDGTLRWIRDQSYLTKGGDGVQLAYGIAEDVTDLKHAEQERLTQAFHQRDALVREVHHRIKNNLQGVVGLLRQKTRKHPVMAAEIEEAIVQLQAVAVVYGLQSTRADGLVSLADMVEAICASAEGLIGGRVERAFERTSVRPACVAGNEAVSLAVALNELVTNALKHQSAEAGRKRAQVSVLEKGQAAEIHITNRGHLPKGFDYAAGRATGNGLGLVRTLLASPGAAVSFNGGRSKVEVTLKLEPPLLAERMKARKRRAEHGTAAGTEKAAAAHTGRG